MDGFQLMLQNYCSYCPDFEPEVNKVDCTIPGDSTPKTMNNIWCQNERRRANIAENMKQRGCIRGEKVMEDMCKSCSGWNDYRGRCEAPFWCPDKAGENRDYDNRGNDTED